MRVTRNDNESFKGIIVQGHGKAGSLLGHPTYNLVPDEVPALSHGSYAAMARHGQLMAPAVLYVGTRPTMGASQHVSYEVHLIDGPLLVFDKAYALQVDVEAFLRPDQFFPDVESLRRQLRQDRKAVRRIFAQQTQRPPQPVYVA